MKKLLTLLCILNSAYAMEFETITNDHNGQDIIYAIRLHLPDTVQNIINRTGFDINAQISFEGSFTTPLEEAVRETIQVCNNRDKNPSDGALIPPTYTLIKIVENILKKGALIHPSRSTCSTFFTAVAQSNKDTALVNLLLIYSAHPNLNNNLNDIDNYARTNEKAKNIYSDYPLHQALAQNKPDLVHLLLEFNAKANQIDKYGRNPTDYIWTNAFEERLKFRTLLKNRGAIIDTAKQSEYLLEFITDGNFYAIENCIENGADINAPQKNTDPTIRRTNITPLIKVITLLKLESGTPDEIHKKNLAIFDLLVTRKANVNGSAEQGRPLRYALLRTQCHLDVISRLLTNGANPNLLDDWTKTSGLSQDEKQEITHTPLTAAIANGASSSIVQQLLNFKADPNIRNGFGKNAFDADPANNYTNLLAPYKDK